jgi:hypothetical protein
MASSAARSGTLLRPKLVEAMVNSLLELLLGLGASPEASGDFVVVGAGPPQAANTRAAASAATDTRGAVGIERMAFASFWGIPEPTVLPWTGIR